MWEKQTTCSGKGESKDLLNLRVSNSTNFGVVFQSTWRYHVCSKKVMYIAVHIMYDVAPSFVDFTPNYLLLGLYILYITSLVHTLSSGLLLCKNGICTKKILKVRGHFLQDNCNGTGVAIRRHPRQIHMEGPFLGNGIFYTLTLWGYLIHMKAKYCEKYCGLRRVSSKSSNKS